MTRQNVTDGPREILTKKCPTCAGDGIVLSEASAALEVERRLRTLAAGSRAQAFQVEVNPKTMSLLLGKGGSRLAEIEEASKKRFFLAPKEGVHADHAAVLAEGKLVDLQPPTPIAEGTEVDLKLVELDKHDAGSAVGKLDGIDVVVGGAAKLVGKKAKVRVERVLDGVAYATALNGVEAPAEPITFESEAEKPTRAPSRAKKAAETDEPEAAVETPSSRGRRRPRPRPRSAEAARARARGRAGRGDRGRGRRRRGRAGEEEDAPRLPRRPEPEEEARRRRPTARSLAEAPEPRPPRRLPPPRRRASTFPTSSSATRSRSRRGSGRRSRSPSRREEGDGEAAEPGRRRGRRGDGRRRGDAGEEEDAPRLPRRPQPEEAGGRGSGGARTAPSLPQRLPAAAAETSTNGGEPAGDDYVPMSEWLDDLDA